ncbi:MAG: hypothetical protein PHI29_10920 [Gallionella sp.]|nr:hypothetical protein [Gallionella sp.]
MHLCACLKTSSVSLLLLGYSVSFAASEQGERIYQYDMGCVQIAVYEQLPEIINGVATRPAQHKLVLTSMQKNAILDNVNVNPSDAYNITPASLDSPFPEGFIELERVPGGISMVVLAQDPTQPFKWRYSAKCHRGGVEVLHFDEIRSRSPHTDVQDKRIDKIFFASKPTTKPSPSPEVQSAANAKPRNEIDSMLAGLGSSVAQPVPDAAINTSFADELYKADRTRLRNDQLQQLASATEQAEYQQTSALTEARQIASRHLNEYREAQRREAQRRAEEQEQQRNKVSGAEIFFGVVGGGVVAAGAAHAGLPNAIEYGVSHTVNALNGDGKKIYQDGQREITLAQERNRRGGTNTWEVAQNANPSYQAQRAAPVKQPYKYYQYQDKCGNGTPIDIKIPYRTDACLKIKIEFTKVHACHYADEFARVERNCTQSCGNAVCGD